MRPATSSVQEKELALIVTGIIAANICGNAYWRSIQKLRKREILMSEEVELPAGCEGCSECLYYPDCDRHASCRFRSR